MLEKEMAKRNLIYKARTGSNAYGTVTEESDDDFVGIFIPDKEYVIGTKRVEQVISSTKKSSSDRRNIKGDIDYTAYSLVKFIHLAKGNNPNIIELFFLPEKCVLFENRFWKMLREKYHLFISKKAYHTFKGYAYSQKHKMQVKKERMTGRKELVEKFGYDTKFASHLIRLLLEGLEILVEGRLSFPLAQNQLILDIKKGKYAMPEVLEKADELEKLVDEAYIKSGLQKHCCDEDINLLQMVLLQSFWREQEIAG